MKGRLSLLSLLVALVLAVSFVAVMFALAGAAAAQQDTPTVVTGETTGGGDTAGADETISSDPTGGDTGGGSGDISSAGDTGAGGGDTGVTGESGGAVESGGAGDTTGGAGDTGSGGTAGANQAATEPGPEQNAAQEEYVPEDTNGDPGPVEGIGNESGECVDLSCNSGNVADIKVDNNCQIFIINVTGDVILNDVCNTKVKVIQEQIFKVKKIIKMVQAAAPAGVSGKLPKTGIPAPALGLLGSGLSAAGLALWRRRRR